MPLIKGKSKKSFSKNVETEMDNGKDQKQALAIAYAVKRKASGKKMSMGGEVSKDKLSSSMGDADHIAQSIMSKKKPTENIDDMHMDYDGDDDFLSDDEETEHMADGGEVKPEPTDFQKQIANAFKSEGGEIEPESDKLKKRIKSILSDGY